MRTMLTSWALASILAVSFPGAAQATQGVTDTEIVVGTHLAMSGPLANWSLQAANGLQMRFDEANAQGGVFGRRFRLIIEDNQFNPARAAQVANKLLNSDRVFAIIAALGTPTNMVVMEQALPMNVPNLFPMASGRQMYEPFHRLKFAIAAPHYDNLRSATRYFVEQRGKRTICTLTQDNEFGREVLSGVEAQLQAAGMAIAAQATHRPDERDFSAQITRLRAANCDLIALGTVITDTIGAVSTARRVGWNVDFYGSSSNFSPEVISLARGATEGVYAMTQSAMPYEDEGTPAAREWFVRYRTRFGIVPGFQAVTTYTAADLFITAVRGAGRNLTVDTLVAALEAIRDYRDPFDAGPTMSFGPDRRLGTNRGFLVQVRNGRWVRVTEDLSY